MSFLSQFRKVKSVLTTITAGNLDRILVRDGRIYATDDRIIVSAPFSTDLEFYVDGKTFGSAIQKKNPSLSMEDNNLVVMNGDDETRIQSVDVQALKRPSGDWRDVPVTMLPAFETLVPFQAEDNTREWACAITIKNGKTYATNNRIFAVWEGGGEDILATFPNWLVDYVMALESPPTGFIIDEEWIGFRFDDDTEVRSVRLGREMTDEVIEFGDAIPHTGQQLPAGWTEGVEFIAELPHIETLVIGPHEMSAVTSRGSRKRKIDSPTTKETMWDPELICKIAAIATHMELDAWPNPAPWYGRKVRGVIVGKET